MKWLRNEFNYAFETIIYDVCSTSDRNQAVSRVINPLWAVGTLKPQSNGPSYSNTVTGTLAVDGWAVTFGTASRGLGGLYSPIHQRLCSYAYGALQICLWLWLWSSALIAVPNLTAQCPPINGQCTKLMCHYNCLWTLKGKQSLKRLRYAYTVVSLQLSEWQDQLRIMQCRKQQLLRMARSASHNAMQETSHVFHGLVDRCPYC